MVGNAATAKKPIYSITINARYAITGVTVVTSWYASNRDALQKWRTRGSLAAGRHHGSCAPPVRNNKIVLRDHH